MSETTQADQKGWGAAVLSWFLSRIRPKISAFLGGALAATIILGLLPSFGVTRVSFGELDRSYKTHLLAAVVTGLALWVIIGPINRFQTSGQEARKDRIRGFYSPPIIARYFKRFWAGRDGFASAVREWEAADAVSGGPESVLAADRTLRVKFENLLDEFLGSTRLTAVKALLTCVAALVLFFGISGGMMWAIEAQGNTTGQPIHYLLGLKPGLAVIAAIFGAYTWVASDVIYRYHQTDISSSDVRWYTLRFVVAIPLGLAIAQFSGFRGADQPEVGNAGPILAFVVSMFSMSRIQEILGGFVNRAFVIPGAAPTAKEDVAMALPGVDQRVADRLASEGVTTIAMIASADPVRLSVRAGLPFDLVLEFIDRAILWQYVGSKSLALREAGWGGASHLIAYADARAGNVSASLDEVIALRRRRDEAHAASNKAEEAARLAEADVAAAGPTPSQQTLDSAVSARNEADALKAKLQGLERELAEAEASATAPRPVDTLVEAMAKKADIDKDGISNLIEQLRTNAHARFIADIMRVGATSNAKRTYPVQKAVVAASAPDTVGAAAGH